MRMNREWSVSLMGAVTRQNRIVNDQWVSDVDGPPTPPNTTSAPKNQYDADTPPQTGATSVPLKGWMTSLANACRQTYRQNRCPDPELCRGAGFQKDTARNTTTLAKAMYACVGCRTTPDGNATPKAHVVTFPEQHPLRKHPSLATPKLKAT